MSERLSHPAADVIVYIDGEDSQGGTHALSVTQSCGGRSLDSALIQSKIFEPTTNKGLIIRPQEVEIVVKSTRNRAGGGGAVDFERVIFWGKTAGARLNISDSESQLFEARTMPCFFGGPVEGMHELNPVTGTTQILRRDVVFNPLVNGVLRGNMHAYQTGNGGHNIFLDPYRTFTERARIYNSGEAEGENGADAANDTIEAEPDEEIDVYQVHNDKFWTLKEAVYWACWALNPDETYYSNPSRDELGILDYEQRPKPSSNDEPIEGGASGEGEQNDRPLQNFAINLGMYLPEVLDKILTPFGFGWNIDYVSRGNRKLRFFRRGVGEQREIRLQEPGENFDPQRSNVEAMSIGVGYQSLINEVEILGDYELYESTFELKPAWSQELDGASESYLTLGSDQYNDNTQYHRVWRDWVLNEAGDYTGMRTGMDEPYAFPEFGDDVTTVPRRRRFLPCITVDGDRLPVGKRGYVVEYKISDGAWTPVDDLEDGTFVVLRNECGIRFSGAVPPIDLRSAGVSAVKVRITASVYSDKRVSYAAKRRDNSVQPETIRQVYDAADKFKFRKVTETSSLHAGGYEDTRADDRKRVREMAIRLRDAWDQADASLSVTIPWLDGDTYKLGEVVTKMNGRNLDFDIGASAEIRYPQIVGISFDCQRQKHTLHLETFRDTRFV